MRWLSATLQNYFAILQQHSAHRHRRFAKRHDTLQFGTSLPRSEETLGNTTRNHHNLAALPAMAQTSTTSWCQYWRPPMSASSFSFSFNKKVRYVYNKTPKSWVQGPVATILLFYWPLKVPFYTIYIIIIYYIITIWIGKNYERVGKNRGLIGGLLKVGRSLIVVR